MSAGEPEQAAATGLWRDTREIPDAVGRTLEAAAGFDRVAAVLGRPEVRRIVVSGNGAALYVAHALWLHTVQSPIAAPPVVALPSGLLAAGRFRWRPGDVLFAVSSSGEFRDLVEAIGPGLPRPFVALTADAGSTIGTAADASAVIAVVEQRAVTHTQVFCAGVAAALAVWARAFGDRELSLAVAGAPEVCRGALEAATEWLSAAWPEHTAVPVAAVTLGAGAAWTAAMEAALLLREVAGIPADAAEAREGGTSSMFGVSAGHLVASLGPHDDPLVVEALRNCRQAGAHVVTVPANPSQPLLQAISSFPGAVALATRLGLAGGRNVDHPDWVEAYYRTARGDSGRD